MRSLLLAAAVFALPVTALAQEADAPLELPPVVMSTEHPGEEAVEPYDRSNAHAGATPFEGTAMLEAFHGVEGIGRVVDAMIDLSIEDPRIAGTFISHDMVRLRRVLKEQFAYILGAPVDYSGRDMATSHRDIGLQAADLGALVENLQIAMDREGVDFRAQNRLLAKLAPMKDDIVTR
jgi:hemoglobin